VVWSFRRLLNVKKGPAAAFLPMLDINSITAPDPTTVVFKLKQPYAPFVAAFPLVAILNRRQIEPNIKDNDGGRPGWRRIRPAPDATFPISAPISRCSSST